MLIIMLVEIEHSEVVIGRGQVRRQLEHGPILFDRPGVVSPLLSGFGLRVKRLNLGCDFVVGQIARRSQSRITTGTTGQPECKSYEQCAIGDSLQNHYSGGTCGTAEPVPHVRQSSPASKGLSRPCGTFQSRILTQDCVL